MPTTRYRHGSTMIVLVSAISMLILLAACGGEATTATPTPTPGTSTGTGTAQNKAALVAALQKAGLTVAEEGSVDQPFLSLRGVSLKVDNEFVQVFEYPDEAVAQKDASKIAPDATIQGYRIDWLGPPHFYVVGRILVIYPGTDQKVLTALESALGKPFAAAP